MHSPSNKKNLLIQKTSIDSHYPNNHLSSQKNATASISDTPAADARLFLKFKVDSGATKLMEREHFGQLYVQKPFYPEGPEVCHVVIVHPPGGVVGGDKLEITNHIDTAANAQITTPGAAKWYKANGHISRQNIKLEIEKGGSLEWLPQETIFFDNTHVKLDHSVSLAKDATYISSEILCFGRRASGESFNGGQITQCTHIRRDGRLIWFEQLQLSGGSAAMRSPLVLAGKTVCATLIAVGEVVPASLLNSIREEASIISNNVGHLGVTQLKSIVVARYLGDSSETARRLMLHVWGALRPVMLGRQAIVPRMWNT